VQLVKDEDEGAVFFEDTEGDVRVPDLGVVLGDGTTVLVEVKNVAPGNLTTSVSVGELSGLRRYGELHGARVLIAFYWSSANAWTLVDLSALEVSGRRAQIGIGEAMVANEMSRVGDALLGTVPPLVFRLLADPSAPAELGPESDGERSVEFTVGAVEISAAGQLLSDPEEIRLAQAMMFFGRWEMSEELDAPAGRIDSISYAFSPSERSPGQNFEIIASLSSICSTSYNLATLEEDGSVSRLAREPSPGALGGLVPADYWSRDHVLRLWRLHLQPPVTSGPVSS